MSLEELRAEHDAAVESLTDAQKAACARLQTAHRLASFVNLPFEERVDIVLAAELRRYEAA